MTKIDTGSQKKYSISNMNKVGRLPVSDFKTSFIAGIIKTVWGTSPVVQWWTLQASGAGGVSLIPGWGTAGCMAWPKNKFSINTLTLSQG